MAYAVADVLVFVGLLGVLWFVLYRLVTWWSRRHERNENDDLIRSVEEQLNKNLKKRG
jgi:hypothetical protein